MGKELLTSAGREELKQLAVVGLITFVGLVIYTWNADLSVVELINGIGQFLIWALLLAVGLRILYLPIQFVRHRLALRRERERERRKTEGTPQERILANIVSGDHRYPQDIPWWRW